MAEQDAERAPVTPAELGVRVGSRLIDSVFSQGPVAVILFFGVVVLASFLTYFASVQVPGYHKEWRDDRTAAEDKWAAVLQKIEASHDTQIEKMGEQHKQMHQDMIRSFERSLDRLEASRK